MYFIIKHDTYFNMFKKFHSNKGGKYEKQFSVKSTVCYTSKN